VVPISQALAAGGIQAAYARYEEIKAGGAEEYYLNEDDLGTLAIQLVSTQQLDLAIKVLGLNIHVYPESVESYMQRARIYLQKSEIAPAQESLLKALSIEPNNAAVARLLEVVRAASIV
jgi:Tfp pilus assembly protein PilF